MSRWQAKVVAVGAWVAVAAGVVTPVGASIPNSDRIDGASAMPAAVARDAACDPLVQAASPDPNGRRVVGQVVVLDDQSGQMVLATRGGQISLEASADTLAQLAVGDVIVVEMVSEGEATASRSDCR